MNQDSTSSETNDETKTNQDNSKLDELLSKVVLVAIIGVFIIALDLLDIIIGYIYYNECPINSNVPFFLITSGIVNMSIFIGNIFIRKDVENSNVYVQLLKSIVNILLLFWLFYGEFSLLENFIFLKLIF
jgi:hypothetical protein